jgi:hypothetical protein
MLNHNLIKRSLASGLVAVGAAVSVGVGPASATAFDVNANGSLVPAPTVSAQPISTASQPTSVTSPGNGGFDWGDAGIGAAGSALLLGAGLLGAGVTRRRRVQRTVVG